MFSSLRNFDFPFEQTLKKPQIGTEFNLKVQMETLTFVNYLKINEREWMIGFTGLGVHIFIFKITEQNETLRIARKNHSNILELLTK